MNAEKRLSNELAGTIGAAPATTASFAGAANAVAAGESEAAGFGGWAAACLVSAAFGAAATAFGADVSKRGGSLRLASITFGFPAGIGCALAVVSAEPPRPTLRARLLKNPSDCAVGAADATRVAGA